MRFNPFFYSPEYRQCRNSLALKFFNGFGALQAHDCAAAFFAFPAGVFLLSHRGNFLSEQRSCQPLIRDFWSEDFYQKCALLIEQIQIKAEFFLSDLWVSRSLFRVH